VRGRFRALLIPVRVAADRERGGTRRTRGAVPGARIWARVLTAGANTLDTQAAPPSLSGVENW